MQQRGGTQSAAFLSFEQGTNGCELICGGLSACACPSAVAAANIQFLMIARRRHADGEYNEGGTQFLQSQHRVQLIVLQLNKLIISIEFSGDSAEYHPCQSHVCNSHLWCVMGMRQDAGA